MEEDENTKVHFFTGLLIGGALGALSALAVILLTPKSGKELRYQIRKKGKKILKDGKEVYTDASSKTQEIYEEVTHQAKELKKDAEDVGEKISDEVHEKFNQVKKVFGR